MEFLWKHSSSFGFGGVPHDAVSAGHDSDGAQIYVGRSHHEGENLPAKVIPSKRIAYVCYNGQEVPQHIYEVLCGDGFAWIPSSHGQVPPNAVSTGITKTGEPLYVGRGHYQGSLTPGKIHPSHHCLYIPYGGAEISLQNYEVLVYAERWITSQIHQGLPPQAVVAGHDSDGATIYVGKTHHAGDVIPGKVIPSKQAFYIAYGGQEVFKDHYEVLTGAGYVWVNTSSGHVPPNAVVGGKTASGEQLYIGRTHHAGSLTPGKIQPSHQCLYIPYGGQEMSFRQYEVLVKPGGL
ncbi:unnamed protein product [Hermetia illucens]|uniref:Uncharacterized protein n=1 Tax=Hermetia illucens TaxID=343691 RepID=A0A7R8YQB8_HERIL|nr:natterin-1-like [Hermetia illucens]CAD7078239.1 unnamed protein product [Hermetia illucens]